MAKKNDNGYNSLMGLDIFLSSLTDSQYDAIKHKIKAHPVFPSMSWGVFGDPLKRQPGQDVIQLAEFAKRYHWKIDADILLKGHYEALVITNLDQEILWVNEGFKNMTGYDSDYAIGRSPRFLQGKNTSEETRERIKSQLLEKIPFTEVIVNYRKNKEEYRCEVRIIPIHNRQNEVTHFIALEKAV